MRFGLYLGGTAGILMVLLSLAGEARTQGGLATSPADTGAQALEQRLQTDSGDVDVWLRLGYERLGAGDLKEAEKAFKKALSMGGREKAARAYNGLGLVYGARSHEFQTAIYYFQKALRHDSKYVEAYYNKARTYFSHNLLSQAIRAAKTAVALDSTYVPARQLLEKCLEQKALDERWSKETYQAYLKSEPKDLAGWMEWGKRVLAEGDYEQIRRRLPQVINTRPEWGDLLPFLAQAYWKANLTSPAWAAFRVYIEGQDESERALYEDIRLVSSQDLADEYKKTSKEGRKELARRFWAERDADFTTPVNERLLEHYRRVWYARTYFAKRRYPWDRRGEVYIRYGEPDHRSLSKAPSPPPTAAVNAVKERFYSLIYNDEHTLLAMGGGSEYRSFEEAISGTGENQGTMRGVESFEGVAGGLMGSLVGPVFPIRSYTPEAFGSIYMPIGSTDFSIVPWESWVYTGIDGGIVIDFTDEVGKGAFDYAPVPELDKTPGLRNASTAGTDVIRALAALARRAPISVMRTAIAAMPERYVTPPESHPLDFYFDQASFRGKADSTGVEVYYGVPMSETTYFSTDGVTRLRAVCKVALAGREAKFVYRSETELIYQEEGDRTGKVGVIPNVAKLDVLPGEYFLDVRVENRLNEEIGSYRKPLSVEAYPAGPLKLSDVQLAWKIFEGGTGDKFSKHGLRVIPMPTRLYKKGQPVYIYYEIYNLKRDESGKANYTVEHTVRSGEPPGLVSQIVRSFHGGKGDQEVSVVQERLGLRETEVQHLELDLSQVIPGKFTVKVTVKDLTGSQTASKEVTFQVVE